MSFELVSLETIQELAHEYGYWTVFLGILLENMGLPVPGETVTLVGGFLAGSGDLNYWWVLGGATSGAVLGSTAGYWVGRLGGWALVTRVGRLFRLQETQLVEVRDQFSKNAPKAVFFGRFITLLRIFSGPLAGLSQMPFPQFLFYNVAGALTWAAVTVTLADVAGHFISLEQLFRWMSQLGLVVLVVVAAAIALPLWLEHRNKQSKQATPD